jgi:hypothetical protein
MVVVVGWTWMSSIFLLASEHQGGGMSRIHCQPAHIEEFEGLMIWDGLSEYWYLQWWLLSGDGEDV